MRQRERGTALLLVLWATMLLAALLIGVAAASRSQSEAALYGSERVRAELAAEAGLAHAVVGLRVADPDSRWVPDGRRYKFHFDGARVTVAVVDVTGQIDLNTSSPDLLRNLFEMASADRARADKLANAVVDWRRGRLLVRGPMVQVLAGTGQSHGPFRAIDQLARVPGMDRALFIKVANAVTVFSGRNYPDASYAGPLVLAALRGIDTGQAKSLVDDRRRRDAQPGAGNGQAFGAVGNGALVAGNGGVVERVFSTAEMPDGVRTGLDVTIRLALTGTRAHPYKVLDWRSAPEEAP